MDGSIVCETKNCDLIPVKYRYVATGYCTVCCLNMCADCVRAHKRTIKTRRHHVGVVIDRSLPPPIVKNEIDSEISRIAEVPVKTEPIETPPPNDVNDGRERQTPYNVIPCPFSSAIPGTTAITESVTNIMLPIPSTSSPSVPMIKTKKSRGRPTTISRVIQTVDVSPCSQFAVAAIECDPITVKVEPEENTALTAVTTTETSDTPDTTPLQLQCPYCPFVARKFGLGLKKHLKSHTMLNKTIIKYPCPLCPYVTISQKRYEHHFKRHTAEKAFICNNCDFSTGKKKLLEEHKSAVHDAQFEVVSVCRSCEFEHHRSAVVLRHIFAEHSNEEELRCRICKFMGRHHRKYLFNRHMGSHMKMIKRDVQQEDQVDKRQEKDTHVRQDDETHAFSAITVKQEVDDGEEFSDLHTAMQ